MIFGKHINKYYIKHIFALLLGVLALLLVDWFQLKIPELYSAVIDGINKGFAVIDGEAFEFNAEFILDKICRPMLVIIIAMVLGRFLWRICLFGTAIKVETSLRGEMFDKCELLSQNYYGKNKVGNLMSLFTNDLETVNECFGGGVLMMFDALLLGFLALYKMFDMHPILTLFSLIPMVFLLIAGTLLRKGMKSKWAIRQEAFSSISDFSQESFSGISVIKAFVKEYKELLAFKKLSRKNEDANVEFTKISTALNVLVTLFVESVICIILGFGGYLVYSDIFTAGELIEFISYFTTIVWPVMAVSQLIEMSSRGRASLGRISELLDTEVDIVDRDGVLDIENVRGDIEYRNLTFRYPGAGYDSLKNVSFKIEAGENVGIIGKTGSGKTTLVDLILRTYNVEDGTLFIDGYDVNSLSIKSVRRASAYVPQDNFLFCDTIENNIAFAIDQNDEKRIVNSARLSDVDSNIKDFPNGYKTLLGERGVTVSGGQKQRISIARALLKDAPILILDDSVSAVDTATERTILKNLRSERQGKTTILIAHRVSTVESMDKVIFIEDGRILAVGSHNELVETCPEYKLTVDLQKLEEEVGKNV